MNEFATKDIEATYCPEDNKLRLYVGRVPKEEYRALRAGGWIATPKQSCDFVATWTPAREDTAIAYAGETGDEDQGPEDRAADRAERFLDYQGKRIEEATGKANEYDNTPLVHASQSASRAERSAEKHDRKGTQAVSLWSKAEYWQERTEGVIFHALHNSSPAVRMGRILKLEDDFRRGVRYGETQAKENQRKWDHWKEVEGEDEKAAENLSRWPTRPKDYEPTGRWQTHRKLRLAYENQMLDAQGGRLAEVEMIAGGFIGEKQIQKVNKSPATGRVTSVSFWGTFTGYTKESDYKEQATVPRLLTMKTERLGKEIYRPPTEKELADFVAEKKKKKSEHKPIPMINPTDEDAEKLQVQLNAEAKAEDEGKEYQRTPGKVELQTQEYFSGRGKDFGLVQPYRDVKIRTTWGSWKRAESVIIITDRKRKPFPAGVLDKVNP